MNRIATSVVALLISLPAIANAKPLPWSTPPRRGYGIGGEIEFYYPTTPSRRLSTGFVNLMMSFDFFDGRFSIGHGLTVSAVSGHIWSDADGQRQRRGTTTAGFGPMFLMRGEPLRIGRLSLVLDFAGALVVYGSRFPPGGDYYNFTWRVGGAITWRIAPKLEASIGARWMHVSNGQGLGPQNPSYEGAGFNLGVFQRF